MKVGSLVYATEQGLGFLAKDFHTMGVVTDPIVVRHSSYSPMTEWYGTGGMPLREATEKLLSILPRLDAVMFFETPFDWSLLTKIREAGKKSILMPMHECTHRPSPVEPDAYFCPSSLEMRAYSRTGSAWNIPVPVPDVFTKRPGAFRHRKTAETFIHNSGRGGLVGRNGTATLLEAIQLVESDAKFILRWQRKTSEVMFSARLKKMVSTKQLTLEYGSIPQDKLYATGDVFVFPEKFNGLSLPMQEAMASGMLMMVTDREPNNTIYPTQPLIPVESIKKIKVGRSTPEIESAIISPKTLAATIDNWYGKDIREYSALGYEFAQRYSWEALKPRYDTLIRRVVEGQRPHFVTPLC